MIVKSRKYVAPQTETLELRSEPIAQSGGGTQNVGLTWGNKLGTDNDEQFSQKMEQESIWEDADE